MRYYVTGGDGQRYGPADLSAIVQWAREGRVIASTELTEVDSGRRIAAGDVSEVARVLGRDGVRIRVEPADDRGGHPARPTGAARSSRPPYAGIPNMYGPPGPKSKVAAGVLGILFGCLGAHRFYLGHFGIGAAQLALTLLSCTGVGLCTISGIWGLIEGILCLCGSIRDAEGRPLHD